MAYVDEDGLGDADDEIDEILDAADDSAIDRSMANPVITRQEEHVVEPRIAGPSAPLAQRQLAATWDQNGNMVVAYVMGGRQIEPFRAPTQVEHEQLRASGRFVRGGLAEAPAPAAAGLPWGKIALGGVAIAALGFAAYRVAKKVGIIDAGDEADESEPEPTNESEDGYDLLGYDPEA